MIKHKFFLSLAVAGAVFGGADAFARGTEHGNGGDALICDGGRNIYLLDYIEGQSRGFSFAQDELSAKSVRENVELFMGRLRAKHDYRGFAYAKMVEEMLADIEAFKSAPYYGKQIAFAFENLPDIDDSKELAIPGNCTEKKQLVIQRQTSQIPEDRAKLRNFKINSDLWAKMNSFQKAMTVMHEVLFWDQIADGAENSIMARYLNENLTSTAGDAITLADWQAKLKLIGAKHDFSVDVLGSSSHPASYVKCEQNRCQFEAGFAVVRTELGQDLMNRLNLASGLGRLGVHAHVEFRLGETASRASDIQVGGVSCSKPNARYCSDRGFESNLWIDSIDSSRMGLFSPAQSRSVDFDESSLSLSFVSTGYIYSMDIPGSVDLDDTEKLVSAGVVSDRRDEYDNLLTPFRRQKGFYFMKSGENIPPKSHYSRYHYQSEADLKIRIDLAKRAFSVIR